VKKEGFVHPQIAAIPGRKGWTNHSKNWTNVAFCVFSGNLWFSGRRLEKPFHDLEVDDEKGCIFGLFRSAESGKNDLT